MSIFTHHGPWNDHSRQSPTLRFLEQYINKVNCLDLASIPSSTFFSPFAEFHDTKGVVVNSGPQIWAWLKRLFTPFDRIYNEPIEVRVLSDGSGKDVVYAEFLTHFRLQGDEEEVVAPKLFVFCVGEAEEDGGVDGMQILEVRMFWDTGILGRFVTEKKRRAGLR